jgi:hypothetical protein
VIAMIGANDRATARARRSDDAVLTEMARSLLREGRPVAGRHGAPAGSPEVRPAGRPAGAPAECARRAAARFRRTGASRPRIRTGAAPVA